MNETKDAAVEPGPKTLAAERILYTVLFVVALGGIVVASPWFNASDGDLTVSAARIGGLGTVVALVGFAAQMVLNVLAPESRSWRAAVSAVEFAGLMLAAVSLGLAI